MTHEEIQKRLGELCQFITDSIQTVESGTMVDLSGLDEEVASICDHVVTLPPAEATQTQPLMAEMIGNLEKLGEALQKYQDEHQA
jgi:hypothetical protein